DSSLAALRPGAWAENDRIRKLGSETLARAATAAGVGVLIQESFAPVYPDRAAHGFSARGGRGIVLRFGAFYGPDAWQVAELIRFIRKGWVPLPARPESFISPVSHDDAASAVAAALAAEAGTYNVVDDRPLPRREFYDLLAAELDVPPPKLPPFWLAPAMGSLVRLLGRSQRISNRKL